MTSTEPFQLTVRRRSEERSSRPATALTNASRSGDRLAVDFDDAPARPQLVARRRRAVREVRDEHAVRSDAALRRQARDAASAARRPTTRRCGRDRGRRARRSAPRRPAPCPRAAPSRAPTASARRARLRGSGSRRRRRYRGSDRPIAAAAPPASRRPAAATPSTCRRSGLCCSRRCTHSSVKPSLRALASGTGCSSASSECSARPSRTSGSISIEQVGGNAAILLHDLAARFVGEARPARDHLAALVDQHAVVVARAVDQRDRLEVGVAELQRARQRERDRIDRRDGRRARLHFAVRRARRPPTPARPAAARRRAASRRAPASSPMSVGSYETTARLCSGCTYSTRPGISIVPANVRRTSPSGDGHGVAIDEHQPALGIEDHARAVVAALGDAGHGIRHVEVDQHERRRELVDDRIGRLRVARGRRLERLVAPSLSAQLVHGHVPLTSSRLQERAGNQRRSMRITRTCAVFGSSSVKKRTGARCAVVQLSPRPARSRRASRSPCRRLR